MPAGGDKLDGQISAGKWNALTALLQPQPQQHGFAGESEARDGIVQVQNLTGANLTAGSIVALRDPIWTPQENLTLFRQALAFHGVVPTDGTNNTGGEPTTNYTGRFGVMLAPAAPGASGPALISGGPVAAKVSLQAEGDAFADIYHNSTTKLKSGSSGSAQILWPTTSTGSYPQDTWAIVRLGNRASAGKLQMLLCATSYGNNLSSTGVGSSVSNPRLYKFEAAYEPRPDWADWDATNKLPIIKKAGKYIYFIVASHEWPAGTGDAQEVVVQIGVRTTAAGTPVFSYASLNSTMGRAGFSPAYAGEHCVNFGLAEFAAGDMLSVRAYHGDAGHTKVTMDVGITQLLLIPYNQD